MDSFTAQQSRLVVIVDGLDSCEQDKVLLVLDAIQSLFSDNSCPFIVILAIDPHIIARVFKYSFKQIFTITIYNYKLIFFFFAGSRSE